MSYHPYQNQGIVQTKLRSLFLQNLPTQVKSVLLPSVIGSTTKTNAKSGLFKFTVKMEAKSQTCKQSFRKDSSPSWYLFPKMGMQDPGKVNYERLNVVLVMGSSVRPCIALCWVYKGLLTARAAGLTHVFKAATVPWAADGHESVLSDHGWGMWIPVYGDN